MRGGSRVNRLSYLDKKPFSQAAASAEAGHHSHSLYVMKELFLQATTQPHNILEIINGKY